MLSEDDRSRIWQDKNNAIKIKTKKTTSTRSSNSKNVIIKRRSSKVRITPFQIFTLIFLYNEESKESAKRTIIRNQTLARRYYPGLPNPSPHISLRQLAIMIPDSSLLSNIMKTDQVYEELKLLEDNDLIAAEWDREYDKDNYVFSLSTSGIIWVKQYLGQLSPITELNEYEENIEKVKSSNELKIWFRELRNKIKGRTQDEIADIVVEGTKKHGISLIASLIQLANQTH